MAVTVPAGKATYTITQNDSGVSPDKDDVVFIEGYAHGMALVVRISDGAVDEVPIKYLSAVEAV